MFVGRADTGLPLAEGEGKVTCSARLGGKPLAVKSKSGPFPLAECDWLLPKTARGKVLKATMTVTYETATVSRSFSRKVK